MMAGAIQTGQVAQSSELQEMREEVKSLKASLNDFLEGSFSFNFTPGRSRMLPQGFDPALRQQRESSPCPLPAALSPTAPAISLSGPAPPVPTPLEELGRAKPSYKLSREVRTIPDLWREWTVGLAGLPAVEGLDRLYGSQWRSGNERQYYSMRKVIVKEVRRRAGQGATDRREREVVAQMEEERLASNASLDKVIKALKAREKGRN